METNQTKLRSQKPFLDFKRQLMIRLRTTKSKENQDFNNLIIALTEKPIKVTTTSGCSICNHNCNIREILVWMF